MYRLEPLQVPLMIAIVVGQEIDQELNQPSVLAPCIEMI